MEKPSPPAPAPVPDTIEIMNYQCDDCGVGMMYQTGTVFTSDPLQYEHRCDSCGKTKALPRTYPYSKVNYRPAETVEGMKHQRDLLGAALGEVLVAAGMIRNDVDMTGPELLLAADTYVNPGEDPFAGVKLAAGAKVARDDGRFYVPVSRTMIRYADNRSTTVLRVASDAFDTVEQAEEFAEAVVIAWNSARRIKD